MRLIVGAVLSAFLFVGTAAAQPETPAAPAAPAESSCGTVPPAPADLPDGANANAQQMNAGNASFNAWVEAANPILTCRRDEAQAAIARADSLREQFNAAAQSMTTAREAWVADVNEFNARNPNQRGR